MKQPSVNIKNKRATFDYELMDTYTAGIVLTGTEIKSIRLGKASLVDTFCYFAKGELWVKNMHIAEYFYLAGSSIRLSFFIKSHHDSCRSILLDDPGMLQKYFLPFLQRDRVYD